MSQLKRRRLQTIVSSGIYIAPSYDEAITKALVRLDQSRRQIVTVFMEAVLFSISLNIVTKLMLIMLKIFK